MVDEPRPPAVEATPHPDGPLRHPEVRYEPRDLKFRWILGSVVGTMIAAAIIHYGVLKFYEHQRAEQNATKRSPFPLAPGPSSALPAEPRLEQLDVLEGNPKVNVYERQESREEILSRYGRTKEQGYVHIPIDQAMKHLENRLPARPGAEPDVRRANGLIDAGEPNSGRMLRGEPRWYER